MWQDSSLTPFRGGWSKQIQLDLYDAPEGLKLEKAVPTDDGAELQLQCDGEKVKPGLKGNLIVGMFPDRSNAKNKAQANRARTPMNVLPAIPFEIVAP